MKVIPVASNTIRVETEDGRVYHIQDCEELGLTIQKGGGIGLSNLSVDIRVQVGFSAASQDLGGHRTVRLDGRTNA